MEKMKIGVLLSGSGTNLQAILDEIAAGSISCEVSLVVASRPDAYGIKRAEKACVPLLVMSKDRYADPESADQMIVDALKESEAELVVMAGYMRKVTPVMLEAYKNKVINLHPALLPSFIGAHAIKDAFEARVKVTGVTVHLANEDYDRGSIIFQEAVPVYDEDTLDDLEERIHAVEHRIYPEVLDKIARGVITFDEQGNVYGSNPR